MKKVISNVDARLPVRDYTDAQKALSLLDALNLKVIFLDLNMPVLNGWQFMDEMVTRQIKMKVYILTSSNSELDRQRTATYPNVVNFLTKPLDQDQVATIQELI